MKKVSFCNNIKEACNKVDLVIIHTEWEEFKALDFKRISRKKKFKIFDLSAIPNIFLTKFSSISLSSIFWLIIALSKRDNESLTDPSAAFAINISALWWFVFIIVVLLIASMISAMFLLPAIYAQVVKSGGTLE